MDKKGLLGLSPIDLIAGIIVVIGGFSIMAGYINLGSLIAGIGLIIEIIKAIMQGGLK